MAIVIGKNLILSQQETGDGASPNSPWVGWQSLVVPSGITADFEDELHPATNLANTSTAEVWKSTDPGDQYVTFALTELAPIDYVAVARHNWGSTGNAVTLEYRVGVDDPWTPLTSQFILASDDPVIIAFDEVDAGDVRIRLSGSIGDPPRAAVIYIGQLLRLQRNIYVGHVPINYARVSRVTNGRSESGQFLGRIVTGQQKNSGVDLSNIEPGWYRSRMDPFIQASVERPFFFSWRPRDYPREIGYCWMTNDPQPRNERPNGMMSIALEYGGIAGEVDQFIFAEPDEEIS